MNPSLRLGVTMTLPSSHGTATSAVLTSRSRCYRRASAIFKIISSSISPSNVIWELLLAITMAQCQMPK